MTIAVIATCLIGVACAEDREEPTIGIDELTMEAELRARLAE